jgi:phosphoribosylanthranilate isomerase
VNNRDLHTFRVDLETTVRLRPLVPHDVTLVAESGVRTAADAARLAGLGVDAMLVGEALVTAADVAGRVRDLTQGTPHDSPRVKICGITTLDDARAAVEAGADMLGFNFYESSPRYIRPADCARLVAALQDNGLPVVTVGVFVNAPTSTISHVMDDCGLDVAQLHGDEPAESLAALGERAFKAIRPVTPAAARWAAQRYALRETPPALLVDAFHPDAYGGTGRTGNWTLAAELAGQVPLLLAGGLDPENVTGAIAQVQPWGVDAASGVESSPGRKDHARMRSFVQAVRACPRR